MGQPIDNVDLYILDEYHKVVPIGVKGEICIGGIGLARGYWNRPELDQERFIEHPYKAGHRLYRTGDIARWLPDGQIAFAGRIDDQVKIRGYRIELSEVKVVLEACPLVRQSAVLAQADDRTQKRLVAYVVPDGSFDRAGIKAHLKTHLPDYMVPYIMVEMESLPLNANGKIDKKALPQVDIPALLKSEYVAPRNQQEALLCDIWSTILDLERIGVEDNFFDLGGHSLLATRIVFEIKDRMGVQLAVKDLFAHPDIASLSQLLTDIDQGFSLPVKIDTTNRSQTPPLSFAQERLWFLDQLNGSANYHMPYIQDFSEALDLEILEDCFRSIVNRHEALRTVIQEKDGRPYQEVLPKDKWVLDYEELEGTLSDSVINTLVREEMTRPFKLSTDHMLRVKVFKMEQTYRLIMVMHHIASDGWSVNILMKELEALYTAKATGQNAHLAPLEVQYADYAAWQQEYLDEEKLNQKLAYWEEQLKQLSPLNLPLDFARPRIQSTRGASIGFELDTKLSKAIFRLCKKEEVTLYMLLLSAFKILLYRYSGQSDICVGSPIANRMQKEVESLIGFFANTLALRTDLGGDLNFSDLLAKVKQMTLEGYKHQDTPFEKVVERVVTKRDMSRSPLFQAMFVLQQDGARHGQHQIADVLLPQLSLSNKEDISRQIAQYEVSKFDLSMYVVQNGKQLKVYLEYCKDLFKESTILRMQDHFCQLLNTIIHQPKQKINKVPMLTPKEERQQVVHFNATTMPYNKQQSLIHLFEERVTQQADEIALLVKDQKLSYAQLNQSANQLAHHLKQRGVQTGDLVTICMDRSAEMIIGLLGILKTGAAYVPVDPAYPAERIRYILEDAQSKFVLSKAPYKSLLAEQSGIEVILMDEDWTAITQEEKSNLPLSIGADHLFYVIYTSGSTGKPKGVMITNQNTQAFINWCRKTFSQSPFEVVYGGTSICFDLSVFEIFYTLCAGKRLRLLESGMQIGQYLQQDQHILLNTVPTVIAALLDEEVDWSNVNVINMAGEPIPISVQERLDVERIEVRNLYGPSEDTTYSTIYRLKRGEQLLIGRPIANTQAYVLDEHLNLLPQGVIGELYLSGDGVAKGYLKRPELTAERFLPNPYAAYGGDKLYRTGDLARWLPNGQLDFIGRKDAQVKIRGYRIELGEIEAVLQRYAMLSECAVIAHEDSRGSKRLVAYVVMEESLEKDKLTSYLKTKLPEFMIPSLIIEMEALPLTPNGKVDKKALAEPAIAPINSDTYVAPRNDLESQLAVLWQDLLQVPQVGIYDNFFELGGHSLLMTRLTTLINKEFDLHISIKMLFEFICIADLAAYIRLVKQQNGAANNGQSQSSKAYKVIEL
ncbi:MAG: amino acid adenylation domain-containing protein [Bacteroidota bacterium]